MKIVNVKAFSLSDAKKNVPFGVIKKNATQMWKKAGCPEGLELREFCKNYLEKHTDNLPNVACYIVINNAISDSRENPYKVTNVVTNGKRKFKRMYELVNVTDGTVLGVASSKEEAKKLAKSVVSKLKQTLGVGVKHICRIVNVVTEGQTDAFTFEYVPSQNAKEGTFLFFGVENDTI